jgi:hypothetical protein
MTSFAKKELGVVFLCVSLGVLALSYPFFVSAITGTIFIDTFENYNLTNLNGQHDWVDPSTHWIVIDTLAKNGTHSIYNQARDSTLDNAIKYGDQASDGEMTLWFYLGTDVGTYKRSNFILRGTDTGQKFAVRINDDDNDNKLQYTDENWSYYDYATDVSKDEWHKLDIVWEFGDWHYKMKMDNQAFTSWISMGAPISPLKGLEIATYGYETWVDSISGTAVCELGNCALCSDFSDCINAGCQWFYEPRFYPPLNYCDEPEGALECGDYQHCAYCLTQEECELKEECVWSDLGTGEKCHWQIYVPPVPVEYPACEMADCNPEPPLGLVEKWICLLKNAMTGIFCPSEETTDNLKNSIDVLNEKFPFNYIEAVKQFVVDIKTSLAIPKEITISMFGASGTMNFDFLDMPITIGGVEETMGNIFTDITSIFIYIAFFFWLLAFIRRFF